MHFSLLETKKTSGKTKYDSNDKINELQKYTRFHKERLIIMKYYFSLIIQEE